MGIPIDIYSLIEITLSGGESTPLLLTRVRRAEFANWSQADEDDAIDRALQAESRLTQHFVEVILGYTGCFETRKLGELQGYPVGGLGDDQLQGEIELWVAATSYGDPWVVLGTAPTEAAFWSTVNANDELLALKPLPPARCVRAYYLPSTA